MEPQTAIDLRESLKSMEAARQALESVGDGGVVDAANAYQRARELAGPSFVAAQREYELETASSPAAASQGDPASEEAKEADSPRPREAAPGVPLVSSPGMTVTPGNIADFGLLQWYLPRQADETTANPVQATAYAFDVGTAVQVVGGEEVATGQPSRIVVGADGLGVVAQDQFGQSYTDCPPDQVPGSPPATAPVGGTPEPVSQDAAPAEEETPEPDGGTPQTGAEGAGEGAAS